MDRQAEREGLGPAGQVSQNPAKLSAKPLPLSHQLATYSFHPFSACAHCLACLRHFFYGFGDLVTPPVGDGATSQGQSSGEAVLAQLAPRQSSVIVGLSQLEPQALQLWEMGWAAKPREMVLLPSL